MIRSEIAFKAAFETAKEIFEIDLANQFLTPREKLIGIEKMRKGIKKRWNSSTKKEFQDWTQNLDAVKIFSVTNKNPIKMPCCKNCR